MTARRWVPHTLGLRVGVLTLFHDSIFQGCVS
jgi:hypothetical protein